MAILYPVILLFTFSIVFNGLPWWLNSKESTCNVGDIEDLGLVPGSRRFPGRGNGSCLQYSCLGQRTLVGSSPLGHKESDTTKLPEHACMHNIQ